MGRTWTEEQKKEFSKLFATEPLCPDCGETEHSKFYLHKKNGRRASARCKECQKLHNKTRYHSMSILDKRAVKARAYGLSAEEYKFLVDTQQGKCAICKLEPDTKRGIHIDHDHATGKVRGLLCHGCNTGLGHFKDNPQLLQTAINYLKDSHGRT
jgi:hypothetical protein